MSTEEEVLDFSHTIAVVGLSPDPERPSHSVARSLKNAGYRIIPVNPNVKEVLGEKAYPDLTAIPEPVDTVDVFRRSEDVMPIVGDAIKIKAKAVWLQEGVINEEAAKRAREAGLIVVMDRCMATELSILQEKRGRLGGARWLRLLPSAPARKRAPSR